jgi:hypothetical protein
MKITSISATYTRKFNLGDYESLEASETIWCQLDENDDPVDSMDQIMKIAVSSIYQTVMPTLKNNPYQIQKRKDTQGKRI